MDELLNNLSILIRQSLWLAPLLAVLAGVLTSVTPCSLSSVPLIIGYVGGAGQHDTKRSFWLSVTFAIGGAVTFTILGVIASTAGKFMGSSSSWWYIALGIIMLLMALQTWEVYNFIPSTSFLNKNTKRGYLGALIAGILGGVFSSPCATPVLIVLMGILAEGGNMAWGILLMLCYSLGHSFLTIVAGTSVGFIAKINNNASYGTFSKILKYILGTAILGIAIYMFYLAI